MFNTILDLVWTNLSPFETVNKQEPLLSCLLCNNVANPICSPCHACSCLLLPSLFPEEEMFHRVPLPASSVMCTYLPTYIRRVVCLSFSFPPLPLSSPAFASRWPHVSLVQCPFLSLSLSRASFPTLQYVCYLFLLGFRHNQIFLTSCWESTERVSGWVKERETSTSPPSSLLFANGPLEIVDWVIPPFFPSCLWGGGDKGGGAVQWRGGRKQPQVEAAARNMGQWWAKREKGGRRWGRRCVAYFSDQKLAERKRGQESMDTRQRRRPNCVNERKEKVPVVAVKLLMIFWHKVLVCHTLIAGCTNQPEQRQQ